MRTNSTQESCFAPALYVVVASPPVLGSTELIPGPRPRTGLTACLLSQPPGMRGRLQVSAFSDASWHLKHRELASSQLLSCLRFLFTVTQVFCRHSRHGPTSSSHTCVCLHRSVLPLPSLSHLDMLCYMSARTWPYSCNTHPTCTYILRGWWCQCVSVYPYLLTIVLSHSS